MSATEKGKSVDKAKAVKKAHYEREMKTYIPPKGEAKMKLKDPNALHARGFFLFQLL